MTTDDAMPTPAFLRRLDRLDRDGLENLRQDLVGRKEAARLRFDRTLSMKDGKSLRRRSHEMVEVRARLRRLDAST